MIRVSEGKYRIGDTKVLIFVRILRSHVMVRVGGGWDTLSHYLDKHDPCRCRSGHRAALSSKLILKNTGAIELNNAQVHYERSPPRTRRSSASSSSSGNGGRESKDLLTAYGPGNRSRSPTPKRDAAKASLHPQKYISTFHFENGSRQRSVSPMGRGRSTSPGVPHRPSYDAPTAASRNRSRSPSVRPEVAKKPGDVVMAKENGTKFVTAVDFADGEVNKQRAKVVVEANEVTNVQDDSKQNDSGSEVSDEGYRSLGLIVSSPMVGEGKVVTNEKSKMLDKSSSAEDSAHVESPTSVYSSASNDEYSQQGMDDDAESKRSLRSSPQQPNRKPAKKSISREPSIDNTGGMRTVMSSPQRRRSEDRTMYKPPVRKTSYVDDKQNKDAARKMTRSRSASGREPLSADSSPIKRNVRAAPATADKYGTWNGKTKKRSDLTADTFGQSSGQFVRNGVGRASLGAGRTTYDPATGRRIQKPPPPPEANMSPLLADLLKTKNLDDDKFILLKMKEIIDRYSDIVTGSDKKYDSSSEDLDFTTEWVRNNGSIKRIDSDGEERCSPHKRKDSKFDGTSSKIPAPVFYKQQVSEKEY
ncbi:UNVERIFIED_CONTAM: hypothetical protein PYX00_009642 [Menopon gallinae]|uniref:GAR domain-containing protein n=1 Tax=Menopon gallinae TaxID=328185 RepID=A0AAW2HC41_9NEOP